jgi:crossover junction endodeoxyribonuclease RuvC
MVRHLSIILGIDSALNNVGYGVLFYNDTEEKLEDLKYGMYPIKSSWPLEKKIFTVFETTVRLIRENGVEEMAIENMFHNPKRAKGSARVREAIGAIKVAAVQEGVPIFSYTAQQVKKKVGGHGRCSKEDLGNKVSQLSGIERFVLHLAGKKPKEISLSPEEIVNKKLDHVTDAIAIAYCRLFEKIREVH